MEMVLDCSLHRPLHYSELVLDSVLRWGYWDDSDCKNNRLVLTANTIYEEVAPLVSKVFDEFFGNIIKVLCIPYQMVIYIKYTII